MAEQIDLKNQTLTDTHTHIYYQAGTPKLREQMDRCFQNGISRLFLPNVDVGSMGKVFETVKAYPENCFAMLGLHPCDVKENYQHQLDEIYKTIQRSKIYAIGEIGIDLYGDKATLDIQVDAFNQQINWAKELGLPISIHCREAFDEVFEILEANLDDRLFGVLHCFTGTSEQAHRAIELGFKLGIGGVLTFKKAGLDAVVNQIDLEHIVLETDAPYLAPVPFRGKENESSYLIHVAQKLADIHEMGIDKIAEITTNNSKNIFKI